MSDSLSKITAAAFLLTLLSAPVYAGFMDTISGESREEKKQDERDSYIVLLKAGKISGVTLQNPEGLYTFYKNRDFKSMWIRRDDPNRDAGKVIKILEESWTQGFNPANYHVETLRRLEKENGIINSLENPLEYEILMSDAVSRYGRDLSGMRLSAYTLKEDRKSWNQSYKTEDLLKYVSEGDPENKLEDLKPKTELYAKLETELEALLKDIKDNPAKPLKPIAFPGLLKPGQSNSVIPLIRARLHLDKQDKNAQLYDDHMVEAVEKFQKENGLKADGVIGKRTINVLNQGRRYRVVQILSNLERLRWMPPQMPDKFVIVNVPAQMLQAVEEGKTVLEMPVIVGKPDWPTMSFKTDITGIRFNPSWYVPPTIKSKDLLPQLRADPNYLNKKNIGLLTYTSDGAKQIDARSINWNNVSASDMNNFGMIQNPGDDNPLGKIRVLMPNQYNIYLHDTNSPDLFVKEDRALSHGCIRLAEPKKVANFILGDKADWNEERLEALLKKTNTIEISAQQPLPVYIVYNTIWQDDEHKLIYGQDFYGQDEKLAQALETKGKLPIKLENIR